MNPPAHNPAFADGTAYIDEQFLPISEARIPIIDWGFLHSDATYDVAHVWQGRFFRLDDHLDRFTHGMEQLHMSLPCNRDQIREVLFECVRLSGLQDAYVEMICTRGIPAHGSRDPRHWVNRFYAFAIPFVWIAASSIMESRVQSRCNFKSSIGTYIKTPDMLPLFSMCHDYGFPGQMVAGHVR
ncbi:aminotransferase class IV [bacterium]|nr:aminotransferase class IV [bacterium]